MHVGERAVGDYRIYTVATVTSQGGYLAGVAICRVRGEDEPERIFFNPAIADGFRFKEPEAALRYAMDVGHRELRVRSGTSAWDPLRV